MVKLLTLPNNLPVNPSKSKHTLSPSLPFPSLSHNYFLPWLLLSSLYAQLISTLIQLSFVTYPQSNHSEPLKIAVTILSLPIASYYAYIKSKILTEAYTLWWNYWIPLWSHGSIIFPLSLCFSGTRGFPLCPCQPSNMVSLPMPYSLAIFSAG